MQRPGHRGEQRPGWDAGRVAGPSRRARPSCGSDGQRPRQSGPIPATFDAGSVRTLLQAQQRPVRSANTFPYIQVNNPTAKVEHEATTSKIGEDQLFYFRSRGVGTEEAVSMIINGFCKDVFQQLPMEFAVEATKLLGLKLEGSVG